METAALELTPLATAEAALAEADAAIADIERSNESGERKLGELIEKYETAVQLHGADHRDTVRARASANALTPDVMRRRETLELAQRRRAVAAERVASERRAIAMARQAVAAQAERVARQTDALDAARETVVQKQNTVAAEERRLAELRRQLVALVGEEVAA